MKHFSENVKPAISTIVTFLLSIVFAAAQNVGIGVTTPLMKLHVKSSDSAALLIDNEQTLSANIKTSIYLRSGNWYTGAIKTTGTGGGVSRLGLFTYASTNANDLRERLSIVDEGNVGIGNISPTLGGLVVDHKVGAVNSVFGSNTSGVAIESNYPGIGFNSYFDNIRKAINTGYGSLVGQDPYNGKFYIQTSATSVTGQGTALPTIDRLVIKPNGNVGIQGNTDPQSPLSFSNDLGEKINFYNENATAKYGIGVQGSRFQFYTTNASGTFQFGHGTSSDAAGFTETMRIQNDGKVGIGIDAPGARLHVRGNSNEIAIQASQSGTGIALYANATNNNAINAINSGIASTARFVNFGNHGPALTTIGKVGINNANPAFSLDIMGRMRVGHEAETAGIWFNKSTNALGSFIGQFDDNNFGIYGAGNWGFLYDVNDGAVKIGTTQKAAGYKLNVGGKIIAEEVRVQLRSAWPDYVFNKNYKLQSLKEVANYISINNHLPNVPAAADVEKSGIALGEMQTKMMEKIEELTLYVIKLENKINQLTSKKK